MNSGTKIKILSVISAENLLTCHCHKGLLSNADFIHQDTEQRWQGDRQPQVNINIIHDTDKKIPFAADSI